jgi:hypothetical protein
VSRLAIAIGLLVLASLAYFFWPQIHILIDAFSNQFNL